MTDEPSKKTYTAGELIELAGMSPDDFDFMTSALSEADRNMLAAGVPFSMLTLVKSLDLAALDQVRVRELSPLDAARLRLAPIGVVLDWHSWKAICESDEPDQEWARRSHIVADASLKALGQVDVEDEQITHLADFASESARMLRDDQDRGAQALATVTLDTLLGYLGKVGEELRKARIEADVDPDLPPGAALVARLGPTLGHPILVLPYAHAPAPWKRPAPTEYTRHGSVHRVGPEQYTCANAAKAVTILSEAIVWLSEGDHRNALAELLGNPEPGGLVPATPEYLERAREASAAKKSVED